MFTWGKKTHAERERIRSISMDMSPAYIHTTLDWIPDAKQKICFDKFHVAQD
ncbi:MAG: transposase, partial [Saccharospirillum sp.]|nr:transposase [Saccharospirillum sp.]